MNDVKAGVICFLVDNPHPFMVIVHVDEDLGGDWLSCTLRSEIHFYTEAILERKQLARITAEDELTVELYARGVD